MLQNRDDHWYGDNHEDIRGELKRYSDLNGYAINHYADCRCSCGGTTFRLTMDDTEGAAIRTCAKCKTEHPIGDSAEYLDEAELEECACPCGNEQFELSAGVSLYEDSQDVRWIYIGCLCTKCSMTACYGDWSNEFIGYKDLLAKV